VWPVVVIVKYNFEDGLDCGTVLICRPELRALSTSNFYHLALRRRSNDLFISSVYSMVWAVANTEGERSFSVLKRVKNQLRSTVGQEKLCDFMYIC
jgi:hypothetical protein